MEVSPDTRRLSAPKARWPANNASLTDDEQNIHCTPHFGVSYRDAPALEQIRVTSECLQPLSFSERVTYLMSLLISGTSGNFLSASSFTLWSSFSKLLVDACRAICFL